MDDIRFAKEFAIQAHGEQKYGTLPYEFHLQGVVMTVLRFGFYDSVILCAAWLHDVIEDTPVTKDDVEWHLGPEVSALVWAVTDEPGANRLERKLKTYSKIRRPDYRIARVYRCSIRILH